VTTPSSLVPFRWPAEWKDPSALALLKGTPINCLAGSAPPAFPTGDLPFVTLDAAKPPDGTVLVEGVWPRVLPAKEDDTTAAGVTGGPWVDSNAGGIRLAQAKEPAKLIWLTYSPPPKEVIPFEEYVRPVAEAAAYGARWVISLDAAFAQALGSANTRALGVWRQMMAVLKLFASRSEWQTWQPVANLAVVSSFQGDMQLVAEEFLALAPRRHLAHRVVLASDFARTTFEKQKAIIYLDALPSAGDTRAALLRFAENGGTVLAPRGLVGQASGSVGQAAGLSSAPVTRYDHNIHTVGRGRVISPIDTWEDPFTLVRQVQLLLSIRDDVVQVWNGGDMNSHYLSSPDGRRAIVHLVPYASGNTQPVTIGVRQRYRAARVTTSAAAAPVATAPVTITAGGLGFEIPVGEFSCFAAVELDI
jgi:hypothetical protein